MDEAFPCPLEICAASSLLLLSTTRPNCSWRKINYSETLMLSDSRSTDSSSTVSSEHSASSKARVRQFQISSVVDCSRELKLKVVRKTRSKTLRISDCRKIIPSKSSKAVSGRSALSGTSEAASSCLSSSSIASVCKPRSCKARADAILRILSSGCTSEVRIRQLLGDSPDTSKALRMLLKKEEVKRSGVGGRTDPYIYTKA